jgi:hypothetical protein
MDSFARPQGIQRVDNPCGKSSPRLFHAVRLSGSPKRALA